MSGSGRTSVREQTSERIISRKERAGPGTKSPEPVGEKSGPGPGFGRFVHTSLPLIELPVGFVSCNAVAFLQPACKFLSLAADHIQVIIRQLGPALADRALHLLPLTFNLVPV